MIPRLSPPLGVRDTGALLRGWVDTNGVRRFEREMAAYTGKRHALAFPYGRSGLLTLFEVMGWRGREIIMPAFSCAVVPNAILGAGAEPRFVDVSRGDCNMTAAGIAETLTDRTAAVIATHMYGFPCDLAGLRQALSGHNHVNVIQDCALALASQDGDVPVWRDGLAAMFSFSIGKQVSSIEGGMIVTDDADLDAAMRSYRDREFTAPGLKRALAQSLFYFSAWLGLTPWLYHFVYFLATKTSCLNFLTTYYDDERMTLPKNLKELMPSCLGYVGESQMHRLGSLVEHRDAITKRLRDALQDHAALRLPHPRPGASYSHCPIFVRDRDGFLNHMLQHGVHVGTEVFDYALPDIPLFHPYAQGDYSNTRKIVTELALLPNHPRLTDKKVAHIAAAAHSWAGP